MNYFLHHPILLINQTLKKEELLSAFKAAVVLKNTLLYVCFRVLPGLKREAYAVIYKLSSRFNSLVDALDQDSLKINARTWSRLLLYYN